MADQPMGFWEKFKAANAGNKVLGLDPDKYAMLAGSLAHALAPNTPVGRIGQAAADYGTTMYQQRMHEQEPAYRESKAKVDALERTTQGITQGTGTSTPAGTQAPVAVDPYFMALGAAQGTAQAAATSANPYAMQKEEAEGKQAAANLSLTGAQTQHTQASTGLTQAQTQTTQAALPYVGPTAEAEMQGTQAKARYLDIEAALVGPKFEFEKWKGTQELGLEKGRLGLGYESMRQQAADREALRSQQYEMKRNTELAGYGDSIKQLQAQEEKALDNPLVDSSQTRMSYGLQYIHKGLEGYSYSQAWQDPSFVTTGGGMLQLGVNNVVAAINGAQTVEQKKQLYHAFIPQIMPLRSKNYELFKLMWDQLHSGLKMTETGRGLPFIGGSLFGTQTFNPSDEAKAYK